MALYIVMTSKHVRMHWAVGRRRVGLLYQCCIEKDFSYVLKNEVRLAMEP